jgi:cell wall-associated NlpC family hydrolase
MKRLVQSIGALAMTAIVCLAIAPPAGASVPLESGAIPVAPSALRTKAAVFTVTVRPGNSLSWLSGSYCGTQAKWPSLWAANPSIKNPNLIYVGQRLVVNCTAKAGTRTSTTASRSSTRVVSTSASAKARTVINYALAQKGKQYCWAGSGPYCFDCSGLVMVSFARIGIRLPHQSGWMLRYGTRISRSQLRPGDIVWPQWGHVAIYLGSNRIVHAANSRQDVIVSSLYGFYTARRVIR